MRPLTITLAAILALTFALVLALGVRTVAVERRLTALEPRRVSNLDTIEQHWTWPDGSHIESLCGTTTLWAYVEGDSAALLGVQTDVSDLRALVYYFASDEAMRGHLMRHGVSAERLDFLALKFKE
jgi:hypothetical protein